MRLLILLLLLLTFSADVSLAQPRQGQQLLDSLLAEVPKMKQDTAAAKVMRQIATLYWYINPDQGIKWGNRSLGSLKN